MNELAIRILDPEEGQFLRRIEWNAEEFESWMTELSEQYAETVIVTPEDFKAAKKDRAELNRVVKAISARRIEVKKAVLEPYEIFEKELEDATRAINKVAEAIDRSIKDYEAAEKQAKRERIRKIFAAEVRNPFYEQIPASELEFLEFDRIFDPKWLNASAKMATIEKELNEKLNKIEEGIRTILDLDTDPALRAGVMQEFRRTLDLGAALRLHGELVARAQREQEEQRRREAEAAEEKRRQELQALRERLGEGQANSPSREEKGDRAEAPVSGFQTQGYTNPPAMPQSPSQGQGGGKFGPSGAADNAARCPGQSFDANGEKYRTESVVPMRNQAPPPEPPKPPEKTYFVEFRVEGTKDQLMALREYMNRSGLRYGPIQKG